MTSHPALTRRRHQTAQRRRRRAPKAASAAECLWGSSKKTKTAISTVVLTMTRGRWASQALRHPCSLRWRRRSATSRGLYLRWDLPGSKLGKLQVLHTAIFFLFFFFVKLLYSKKFSSAKNFVKSDRPTVRQEFIFVKRRSSLVALRSFGRCFVAHCWFSHSWIFLIPHL